MQPQLKNNLWTYEEAFKRNRGLISHQEQNILREKTIGIPGLGGVGGVHLINLARLGIGGFKIADADQFSMSNFNRQYGAFISTIGHDKSSVMEKFLLDINPEARLTTLPHFINADNIDAFLDGCDLVVDGLDAFALEARLLLFGKCYEKKIPIISAGPIGFSTSMLIMTADSMDLATYLNIDERHSELDKFSRFIVGLTPKPYYLKYLDLKQVNTQEQAGPSVASSVNLCAGFAGVEALKVLLGRGRIYPLPYFHYFDPYVHQFRISKLRWGNRSWLQKIKIAALKKQLQK